MRGTGYTVDFSAVERFNVGWGTYMKAAKLSSHLVHLMRFLSRLRASLEDLPANFGGIFRASIEVLQAKEWHRDGNRYVIVTRHTKA